MPLDWTGQLVLLITAVVANFFSAISGGGVGLIQFPILIFLGLSFATALATHKVASVFLGVGAILRHLKESHLERRACAIILAAGIPGTVAGMYAMHQRLGKLPWQRLVQPAIDLARTGWPLTPKEADLLNHHIAISHSQLEDPLSFFAIGLPLWWLIWPRLLLAFIAVWIRRAENALRTRWGKPTAFLPGS